MTRKRGDQIVYEQRVTEAIARIARCEEREKIVEYMTSEWHISAKQASRYLSTARFRIQRLVDAKRQGLLGEALARHDELRRAGFADKNYDLVLNTDKEDAKLLGLYPAEKMDHSVSLNLDAAIESDLQEIARLRQERLSRESEV